MTAKPLFIKQVTRIPETGPPETLTFQRGINVIVGAPNTGKTKWLAMIDFVLGDRSKVEEALSQDLAKKYSSIQVVTEIAGQEVIFERHWKRRGARGKIFIKDQSLSDDKFSTFMLEQLGMPVVSFPKGNPQEARNWSDLSWRMVLRHIYRQERFWNDIADKQPESEQRAALYLLLGIAGWLYSEEYEQITAKRRERQQLVQARREFLLIFQSIYTRVLEDQGLSVAATKESISAAIDRVEESTSQITLQRGEIIDELLSDIETRHLIDPAPKTSLADLSHGWQQLQLRRAANDKHLEQAERRIGELREYQDTIDLELARLERARVAGNVLTDLRVTNCPVCDQQLGRRDTAEGSCFLCLQPWSGPDADFIRQERFSFEEDQLQRVAE